MYALFVLQSGIWGDISMMILTAIRWTAPALLDGGESKCGRGGCSSWSARFVCACAFVCWKIMQLLPPRFIVLFVVLCLLQFGAWNRLLFFVVVNFLLVVFVCFVLWFFVSVFRFTHTVWQPIQSSYLVGFVAVVFRAGAGLGVGSE